MDKKLPPRIEAALIKYTGLCSRCKRPLDDHDGLLTKEGPQCPGKK